MTALSPSLSPSEGMKLGDEGGLFSYGELPHKRFARKPLFDLGRVVAMWGAMGALIDAQQDPGGCWRSTWPAIGASSGPLTKR